MDKKGGGDDDLPLPAMAADFVEPVEANASNHGNRDHPPDSGKLKFEPKIIQVRSSPIQANSSKETEPRLPQKLKLSLLKFISKSSSTSSFETQSTKTVSRKRRFARRNSVTAKTIAAAIKEVATHLLDNSDHQDSQLERSSSRRKVERTNSI